MIPSEIRFMRILKGGLPILRGFQKSKDTFLPFLHRLLSSSLLLLLIILSSLLLSSLLRSSLLRSLYFNSSLPIFVNFFQFLLTCLVASYSVTSFPLQGDPPDFLLLLLSSFFFLFFQKKVGLGGVFLKSSGAMGKRNQKQS